MENWKTNKYLGLCSSLGSCFEPQSISEEYSTEFPIEDDSNIDVDVNNEFHDAFEEFDELESEMNYSEESVSDDDFSPPDETNNEINTTTFFKSGLYPFQIVLLVFFLLKFCWRRSHLGQFLESIRDFYNSSTSIIRDNFVNLTPKRVFDYIDEKYLVLLKSKIDLCPGCLIEIQRKCFNRECPLYNLSKKRTKYQDPLTIRMFCIRPFFDSFIRKNWHTIIESHLNAHASQGENVPRMLYKLIESKKELSERKIVVNIAIGFDAFPCKNFSRKKFNNFYFKIVDLGEKLKDPVTLAASCVSRSKQPKEVYDKISNHLYHELQRLNYDNIRMIHGGKVYDLIFRVSHGNCDLLGLCEAYGIQIWTNQCGCHRCETRGEKVGRCLKFNDPFSSTLISGSVHLESPNMRRIIPTFLYLYDRLHQLYEGVEKDVLNDFFSTNPSWPGRRLFPRVIEKLENSLKRVQNHTDDKTQFLSLRDYRNISGMDLNKIFSLVAPVVAVTKSVACPLAQLYLLCLTTFTYLLNNRNFMESVKLIGKLLGVLHNKKITKSFTIKSHLTYQHCVDDIMNYGYEQTSTDWIELAHHRFQQGHSCSGSNVEEDSFKRFTVLGFVERDLLTRADSSNDPIIKNRVDELLLCETNNFSITYELYNVPDGLNDIFPTREIKTISKIVVAGVQYTYEGYKRKKTTVSYNAVYHIDNTQFFGSIKGIVELETRIYFLINRLDVESCLDMLPDYSDFEPDTRDICYCAIDELIKLPQVIVRKGKIKTKFLDIVPVTQILCPFTEITFEQVTYLSPHRMN